MLHLHHLENSRSFRILWLLEELKVDYKLTRYKRTQAYLAPDNLKKMHPLGHAPILEVDGRCLLESGFIIEYLLKHYDKPQRFKPADNDDLAWEQYTFWLYYSEAKAMPPLVMRLVFNKVVDRTPLLIKPAVKFMRRGVEKIFIADNISATLKLMEQHLADNLWFAGESFSAADIQMYFVIVAAKSRTPLGNSDYINIMNWLKRCRQRTAFKRAEKKGGHITL